MTRTQKLGLCTWLPEDPVSLAEMNDNFSRLDANGGRSLLLAEAGMRTLGGVMAAVAHQGGHAMYAERVQVDAFQDPDQIAENGGIYYRGKCAQLLTIGLNSDQVVGNPALTTTNDYYHVKDLNCQRIKLTQQWYRLFTFYPDAFGQLTSLKFRTTNGATIKLRIVDTESSEVVVETALAVANYSSTSNYPTFPVNYRLDPNHRYAMELWIQALNNSSSVTMEYLDFTITPLIYTNTPVTMVPMTLPAGTARLELLVHDDGGVTSAGSAAAVKFDSGEFVALTQASTQADKVPGGIAATLRRYTADVPAGAQTAQLKLTLNGSGRKLYDYALIAM